MQIGQFGATAPGTVDRNSTGFNGLTAESFLKMLIVQLQNQDPLEPMDNGDLLNQISAMRNLQANMELGESLKAVTNNQRLATAATMIGKTVTGAAANQQEVTGLVDRAFIRDGRLFIGMGSSEVPLENVTAIRQD